MGVCSSKTTRKYDAADSDQQVEQQRQDSIGQAAAGTPTAAAAAAVEAEAPQQAPEPATPQPASDVAHGEEPMHKYNSAEKPYKSAMRMSDTAKSDYSRRSSSGMSNVGFSVTVDAPDAATLAHTPESAGLSPGKSPRANRRSVSVTTPTSSSSAASADGDDDTEGHRSFAGADSISLKKILDIFYDKVVAHEQLGPYFAGIDMIKLKRHQLRFMALAFGGKELVFEEDPNLNLRKIHYHLIRDKGLSLAHWEMFVGLFDQTMDQLEKELPLETRQAAMRSIHATKHYFVPIGQETEYTNISIAALPVNEAGAEPKCPFAGAAAAEEQQQQQ